MIRQENFPKTTIDLLHAVKGADSDDLLATKLGIERSYISMWRKRGKVSADGVARLAELGGYDLTRSLALCSAEAIRDEEFKGRIVKKLQGVAAGVAIASVTLFLTATPNTVAAQGLQQGEVTRIQIMVRLRRQLGRIPDAIRTYLAATMAPRTLAPTAP